MNPITYCTIVTDCSDKATNEALIFSFLIAVGAVAIMAIVAGIDELKKRKKEKDKNDGS